MKATIGYIMSQMTFSIGNLFCRLSYLKRNGEFVFDKYESVGYWLAGKYQQLMECSLYWQQWGGKGVWKETN